MTNLSDTLAALKRDAESKTGKDLFAWDELKSELLIAFLDGQLVPVPSVERVAQIIHDVKCGLGFDYMDFCREAATAVIAAMQEGRDG